jgi:hypothetical protein
MIIRWVEKYEAKKADQRLLLIDWPEAKKWLNLRVTLYFLFIPIFTTTTIVETKR